MTEDRTPAAQTASPGVRVPRWYVSSLVGLLIVVGAVYLMTGGQVTGGGILVLGLFVALIGIVLIAARLFRGQSPDPTDVRRPATHGSFALSGVLWVALGAFFLTSGGYPLGILWLGVGLLTVLAFGPAWIMARRARRGTPVAAPGEGEPPG